MEILAFVFDYFVGTFVASFVDPVFTARGSASLG